jgi:DNA-binding transcriptional regulator LsrR (DeoR family)
MATDNESGSRYADSELKARAAWHYYIEGLTQERISELLGIGRIKVQRVLSAAREEGIVQFRIRDSVTECVVLEQKLRERFGLREAVVTPSPAESRNGPMMIGHAAAAYLADHINPDDVVAVGWGRTLKFAIDQLPRRSLARTTVVSLLGGLTHAQPMNPTECAWELAEKIGAECYLLPVPAYADRPDQRDMFMRQRSVQDLIFRARRANIAVISVGSLAPDSPIANYGFIKPSELEELQSLGAVGDLLCQFLDADGKVIDHDINHRACAFPMQELRDVPNVILASGGRDKVGSISAVLRGIPVSVLITDEEAAKGLLSE